MWMSTPLDHPTFSGRYLARRLVHCVLTCLIRARSQPLKIDSTTTLILAPHADDEAGHSLAFPARTTQSIRHV
jgi:hypothetical protein